MRKIIKVQKMKLGAEPKSPVNKKVISVFLVAITLAIFAGIMGVMSPSNTQAATRVTRGKPLTKFDRIMYWKGGEMGDIECNMSLPATTYPKCYQPIPQEYALGFINNEKTVERAKREINIKSNGKGNESGAAEFYLGKNKSMGNMNGNRSPLKYFDFFNGASYMGDLYDFRVYPYGNAYVQSYKGSLIEHYHHGGNYVASEWHFYPKNTLKALDELYYEPTNSIVECDPINTSGCTCKDIQTPGSPGEIIVTRENCTYDENAYRDEAGNIIYTGVFRDGQYGPVRYTAKEMEEFLISAENSVRLLGIPNTGVFKGTVAFKDIDSWGAERYAAAQGVESVFTIRKSNEYAARATTNDGKKSIYSLSYFNHLCPDPSPDKICYYAWGGTEESGPGNQNSWMWFNFSSNNTAPFVLIYGGYNHGSMIESSQFYITHVLKDDLAEIPEGVIAAAQEFQTNFGQLYGYPLEDAKHYPKGEDPARVLRFFPIYQYAEYTPYTMNELLGDLLNGIGLKWYSCEEMEDYCLVPYDPEHDDGIVTVGDYSYHNGYDFIDGNKTYYASLSDTLEINFPNTCYSDNTSVKEIGNGE